MKAARTYTTFNQIEKRCKQPPEQFDIFVNPPKKFLYSRTIPIKVESELNSREHWTAKSKRHSMQKLAVHSFLRVDKPDIKPPCTIKLIRIAPRKYDDDNMVGACKYIKDAVAEYFHPLLAYGRADDDPNLHWQYAQEKGAPKEYAIRIEITDLP